MTDRDALIAAIAADPADDLPRLVFADWLEEHGDPAQGVRPADPGVAAGTTGRGVAAPVDRPAPGR
jgi:uncharacterized protein (TIGR02996 family)